MLLEQRQVKGEAEKASRKTSLHPLKGGEGRFEGGSMPACYFHCLLWYSSVRQRMLEGKGEGWKKVWEETSNFQFGNQRACHLMVLLWISLVSWSPKQWGGGPQDSRNKRLGQLCWRQSLSSVCWRQLWYYLLPPLMELDICALPWLLVTECISHLLTSGLVTWLALASGILANMMQNEAWNMLS